jgi:phosphoribosylformimino-5-aminoimidazole carboxamide ribotide isomerase
LEVIPVVDLIGGVVVRARMGERDAYRPITTPLSPTSDPVDVVRGLLSVHPFSTLYVADVDAIRRKADNTSALRRIRTAFPALRLWIDNGAAEEAALESVLNAGLGVPVIGSESQSDSALIEAHRDSQDIVLSLDFRDESFQGPAEILNNSQLWPKRIIVMTLARVGSAAGPEMARISAVQSLAGARKIYAAGGVRDAADVAALKSAGVAGVLVASALHDRRLIGADFASI